jgi:signal peptidase I
MAVFPHIRYKEKGCFMKCYACGLENMPGSLQCFECGRSITDYSQQFELPAVHDSRWLRKILAVIRSPLPRLKTGINATWQTMSVMVYLSICWIPGIAQLIQKNLLEGFLYLVGIPLSLVLGIYLFQNPISNLLLPLGFFGYIWSLADGFYTWRENRNNLVKSKISRIRVVLFCGSLLSMLTIFWAPHTLIMQLKRDDLRPALYLGDRLFVDTRPRENGMFQRDKLMVIDLPTNTTVARLIGLPGDDIKIRQNYITRGGAYIDEKCIRVNGVNEDQDIHVPEGKYLIMANLNGKNLEEYSNIWLVDDRVAIGHIYAVISPTAHRRLLY